MSRQFRAAALAAGVTVAAFAALLSWDTNKTLGVDGQLHGPYDAWQILLLVLTIAAVAAVGGWHGVVLSTSFASALAAVGSYAYLALNDPDADGTWPVGAAAVGIANLIGCWAVGVISRRLATRRR